MFRPTSRAVKHTPIILQALLNPPRRELLKQMIAFSRALPDQFDQPLPRMMAHLTPTPNTQSAATLNEHDIRRLADAVAVWHFRSPLGICLRRSLLRYHFLRQLNLPLKIIFGARFKGDQEGGGLGGHAWLTLDHAPYYEQPQDCEGFVVMYSYPEN